MFAPVPTLPSSRLSVDFQGARLHAERARLQRGPGMPVYDHHPHAAPSQLIGEHQAGRSGSDDEDVRIH
jgi:hypothetical protein